MKNILICIDRDGTLIYDNEYFLGRQKNWKSKIKFCNKIVQGIKLLKKIPNSHLYIITNQPGVAISDFPMLTKKRAHDVTKEIIKRLKNKGAKIDGYELCPHAPKNYAKTHPGRKIQSKLVCDCSCIKPKIGMVLSVLKRSNLTLNETKIYVIGDRTTDVHTAHNAKGFGILIPFKNMPKEKSKVKKLKHKNTYIAKDFLDAAKFIYKRETKPKQHASTTQQSKTKYPNKSTISPS